MSAIDGYPSAHNIPMKSAVVNASPTVLAEWSLQRGEAQLAHGGPLVADTGAFTGRSPTDKFIVRDAFTEAKVEWGTVNQALTEEHYQRLRDDMFSAAAERDFFVQDLYAGADPAHQISVRIATEHAWHALFAHNLFVRKGGDQVSERWTVLNLPSFRANPARHGTRTSTAIVVNYSEKLILIANTSYAGEMKKSIFGVMNLMLPERGVMPMHCSANHDDQGRVALFFGLSGTGKTTLSADASRILIGDDEHGWSSSGVFNFEGGCYAKAIKLNAASEPEIFEASTRFGAVLENVSIDPESRKIDFDDASRTENTRSAYPLSFIHNASENGLAGHPSTVIFLAADAFGVLPPIARLNPAQAMYHFLSGYTAKVAGTERGVTEPQATFSACFGAPFMPLAAVRYAEMLGERLEQHGAQVYLVNTGWTGGPYGVGTRMKLSHTRSLVQAALNGALKGTETRIDPHFGFEVPLAVDGVPTEVLDPRITWSDAAAYDAQARKLARMFEENFARFEASTSAAIRAGGPSVA